MRGLVQRLDPLIVLIIAAVILAIVFPAQGSFAQAFSLATKIGIAVLFFLYGARLSTAQALQGVKHWRLHLVIAAFTFVVFPLVGLALSPLKLLVGAPLYAGIVYLTLVPSTVQSSVAFTSIARGNVAGAIVAASASNLAGVFLTPLLVMLFMRADQGVRIDAGVFVDIAVQLLLPFIVGQFCRPLVGSFAALKATKIVDRGSIAMVVYSAFSAGMVAGVWSKVRLVDVAFLCILSVVVVAFMLWLSFVVAKRLGFDDADRKAIQFCGSKKSLATGLPMAAVIFGGANVGMLILPLMIFHQIQLMMCSALASAYARRID
ncbi:MAG: bile acid:sodium symporter family protein [Corynebacterium sp.]|uniref:bile acid:sodium symporter family protein n=1 Tax=Corynebacterium sp. TaxID=1720 RepID=UPI0026DDCBD4|nr:bile acid:sodium symporter family protein [Corynebacterium sp.]MDO4761693.1 bile acid:sodium symporter family protein [Corynebacterium sp.]